MRDLKIRPGMDTPKAKQKNPTPKDAESILKKHMDKRQKEKEPESRDPVRYATDRVEKTMRRGAAGAADASRRMIKHYQEQKRQGRNSASESRTAAETLETVDGVTPTERALPDTPAAYSDVLQSHAARNKVGNQTVPSQNRGGTKSANAAPQERGRQKAIQDAKATCGRNLAEKRTAERHIVPPLSDRGGTMTTLQKGNSGVSAKGGPAPKSRQAMTKVTRTMRVRPTDHAAPNNAIITHRARAAAQRKAQRKMLQESAQSGGKASKKLQRGSPGSERNRERSGVCGQFDPVGRRRCSGTGAAPDGDPCGGNRGITLRHPLFQREPGGGRRADLCCGGAGQL